MPIYNLSGDVVKSPYNMFAPINIAYKINGDIAFRRESQHEGDYDNYTISSLFRYPIYSTQGFAVYGNKIAQVKENDSLHIIDIETQTKIKEVSMNMGHGNSCQFSDEFYDAGDEFPLFYIRNDGVWVYRIVGTESILTRKYYFSSDDIGTYVAGFCIDSDNRLFYTASYTTGTYITKTGLLRICEWDMDNVTDNGDGTYSMALLASNDLTWFDRFEAVQGCCYHDGFFFIGSGYDNTTQNVVLIDTDSLSISHIVTLDSNSELEGCAWVDDDYLLVGQRQNTYTYKKIEFTSA